MFCVLNTSNPDGHGGSWRNLSFYIRQFHRIHPLEISSVLHVKRITVKASQVLERRRPVSTKTNPRLTRAKRRRRRQNQVDIKELEWACRSIVVLLQVSLGGQIKERITSELDQSYSLAQWDCYESTFHRHSTRN